MAEPRHNCELCKAEATVFCQSDSAYLCTTCDEEVHRANFLVARHVRVRICPNCCTLGENKFSKLGVTCQSCTPQVDDDNDSMSSSSSCVSSTSSSKSKRAVLPLPVDVKVEGILVNWCKRLGVEDDEKVVRLAVELLNGCLGKMTVLPFRVLLAAVFWVAVRENDYITLSRLEQISGVPSKLILATTSRLARVMKRRKSRDDHEEGWAES